MKQYPSLLAFIILMSETGCEPNKAANEKAGQSQDHRIQQESGMVSRPEQVNALTDKEKEEGWILLFDGESVDEWRGVYKDSFPDKGWIVEDGTLTVKASGGGEAEHGGDIITVDPYDNFELSLEFRLTEGANSGIKYFVVETDPKPKGSAIGPWSTK